MWIISQIRVTHHSSPLHFINSRIRMDKVRVLIFVIMSSIKITFMCTLRLLNEFMSQYVLSNLQSHCHFQLNIPINFPFMNHTALKFNLQYKFPIHFPNDQMTRILKHLNKSKDKISINYLIHCPRRTRVHLNNGFSFCLRFVKLFLRGRVMGDNSLALWAF